MKGKMKSAVNRVVAFALSVLLVAGAMLGNALPALAAGKVTNAGKAEILTTGSVTSTKAADTDSLEPTGGAATTVYMVNLGDPAGSPYELSDSNKDETGAHFEDGVLTITQAPDVFQDLVSFDTDTGFSSSGYAVICANGDLTIELAGGEETEPLSFCGNIPAGVSGETKIYGIFADGDLTITNAGESDAYARFEVLNKSENANPKMKPLAYTAREISWFRGRRGRTSGSKRRPCKQKLKAQDFMLSTSR